MTSITNETWIILGATSSMARAFARSLAEDGASILLAGRDMEDMTVLAGDLSLRGAGLAEVHAIDMRKSETFSHIIERAKEQAGLISVAVFTGSMPAQSTIDEDPSLIHGVIHDCFTGPAEFLQMIAPEMETREGGQVVGVGSVAGDRGRIGNYVYGSAKAGFHTYLSGLRNRLNRSNVHVMTVKPGFVDTAMTWDVEGMFLVAAPEDVAHNIRRALRKKRNVIYTPFFWWGIMSIIKSIPEFIFKKLSV